LSRYLTATCGRKDQEGHGEIPSPGCSCGIYAATDLDVINSYLSTAAPVLGLAEMGGRVVPGSQGYRAKAARVAAILLIDEALTLPHASLRRLAKVYRVPALVPHSADPEDYRQHVTKSSLIGEIEEWLQQGGGDA
jgi:hypothetical protein